MAMKRFSLLLTCGVVVLSYGAALAQDETTKVQVKVQIPAKVAAFKDQQLEVRLYEHDPRIADKAATLLHKQLKQSFSHEAGKDTVVDIALGEKAKLQPKMGYYITVFVLDAAGKRTHIGEKDGKSGLCNVLTKGNPSKVTMIVRPVQ
jgi:hypothetical protein